MKRRKGNMLGPAGFKGFKEFIGDLKGVKSIQLLA